MLFSYSRQVLQLPQNWCMMCVCLMAISRSVVWLTSAVASISSLCGREVILRPYSKCASVRGSGSPTSLEVYDIGRSFKTASISGTTVCSSPKLISTRPNTFFNDVFVSLMGRYHQRPYKGARWEMKRHSTHRWLRVSFTDRDSRRISSSFEAPTYFVPLSDIIFLKEISYWQTYGTLVRRFLWTR